MIVCQRPRVGKAAGRDLCVLGCAQNIAICGPAAELLSAGATSVLLSVLLLLLQKGKKRIK